MISVRDVLAVCESFGNLKCRNKSTFGVAFFQDKKVAALGFFVFRNWLNLDIQIYFLVKKYNYSKSDAEMNL